ncbi:MAG: amidohydrolase [Planctomycetaceae bacterium]|nr:amidohydrolase [Planctomycetaceae bacterium]
MHVALVQLDIAWQAKAANLAKARDLTADVPAGSLIVLPEMFDVGFTMKSEVAVAGDSAAGVAELARVRQCTVAAGVVVRDDAGARNACLIFGPDGRELGRYYKRRPFALVHEGRHYAAGAQAVVVDAAGAKLGPTICYDLRHPQVFREPALAGAEVLINVANWPAARAGHWTALLTARAIENQAYVLGCNRCGRDPYAEYPGRSVVIDPMGEVIAEAGAEETVLQADIDVPRVQQVRSELPFLHA